MSDSGWLLLELMQLCSYDFRQEGFWGRSPVCAELESRSEAASDRNDIGMSEVGLSAEQLGNYEHTLPTICPAYHIEDR